MEARITCQCEQATAIASVVVNSDLRTAMVYRDIKGQVFIDCNKLFCQGCEMPLIAGRWVTNPASLKEKG